MHTSFLLFGAELDSKGTVVNECPVDIQSRSPTERVERETNPSSAPACTRISAPTEPAGENRILVPRPFMPPPAIIYHLSASS